MQVADIDLPTCADHVVSRVVSYRAWRGENSLRYCGKRSSKCVRHFVLLPSRHACWHAYKLSYPTTPCALAVHKTRWRRSGEQVNTNDRQFWADISAPYLWCSLFNARLARKIPKPHSLMVRTISVSSTKQTYSKYKLSLTLSCNIANKIIKVYHNIKFMIDERGNSTCDLCILSEYISREAHEIPMDWHSSTERNAQTLFLTELLRGNFKYLGFQWHSISKV